MDRKHWAESIIGEEIGTKHNSLEDAKCIRIINKFVKEKQEGG